MASVNKIILVGNLGRDPETKYLPSGDAVCNFSIATSETWKDKAGEKQEATEWHRISAFGKLAEICGQFLKKGSTVYIEGSIKTRTYEKDGEKRSATEIRADRMQMLGGKAAPSDAEETPAPAPGKKVTKIADLDSDLPF